LFAEEVSEWELVERKNFEGLEVNVSEKTSLQSAGPLDIHEKTENSVQWDEKDLASLPNYHPLFYRKLCNCK
jgi:hypothetical protein